MNNRNEQYKRIISFFAALIMLAMTTTVFGYTWYEFYGADIVLPFYRKGNWLVIGIYTLISLVFFKAFGGLKFGYLKRLDMNYSQFLSVLCINALTYLQISLIGRHFMNIVPIIVMTVVDIFIIIIWTWIITKLYNKIYPPRRLVVVYGSKLAETLVNKMSERTDKYMICASVKEGDGFDRIIKVCGDYEGVILCDLSPDLRNDLVKYFFENSVRIYMAPKISDIIIRGAEDINLFDTPLLLSRNYGFTFEQKLFKRLFDITLSILGLIIFSPIMLVVACIIKFYDGGPIFYKQTRLTLGGKEFSVFKFRSMVCDAEKDGIAVLASDHDDRITPVGAFIRRFRIDEFPQLINILKGEMSIVGPRPERPELTEQYEEEMPEFRLRLKVKAGLTGYAQVTGAYDTTPYDKLKMDLMYISNYSFLTDLRIVLMTIKTMIFPKKNNNENEQSLNVNEKNNGME